MLVVGNEVDHLPQSAADTQAVMGFDLGSGKVGCDMRRYSLRYENVVTTQQDLGHDVALVAVVAEIVLEPEVVKAVDAQAGGVDPAICVSVKRCETVLDKLEADVATGLDTELVAFGCYVSHERHNGGLPAADGAGEQDAFFKIDSEAEAGFLVAEEPGEQPQDDGMVFGQDAEMPAKELDAFALDPADDLIVVIMAPNSPFLLRCRNVVRLVFHGLRILGRSASNCGPRRANRPSGSYRR